MLRAFVSMFLMGILTYFLFRSGLQAGGLINVGEVCVVVTLGFWCVRHVFSLEVAADRYYGGADGEHDVGVVLSRLPYEFHVFNGLGFYAGDVDHIVVGPTGIFIVETKNLSGTISLKKRCLCRNGDRLSRDFVHQAISEAMYVKGWLKPQIPCHVRPLVVFVRAKVRVGAAVEGVRIIGLSSLTDAIMDRAPSLSDEDIRRYARRLSGLDAAAVVGPARARQGAPGAGLRTSVAGVWYSGLVRVPTTRRSR